MAALMAPVPSSLHRQKRGLDTAGDAPAPAPNSKRVRTAVPRKPPSPEPTSSPRPVGQNAAPDTRAVFRQFVQQALDEKTAGNATRYQELRRKFQADPADVEAEAATVPSSKELQQALTALTAIVSRLDHKCSALVQDIVQTPWVGRDAAFVGVYVKFLGTLVSAHASYMGIVTKMLVEHLVLLPASAGKLPGYPVVPRGGKQGIYERVHYALQYILELVPTAGPSTLFPALVAEFPYRDETKLAHATFLRNLLRVIEYQPVLRKRILAVVTDKIIKLDIEIQVFLEDVSDEKLEELEAEIYAPPTTTESTKKLPSISEVFDDSDESEGEPEGKQPDDEEEYEEQAPDRVTEIKETVLKLDTMLDLLFHYYSSSFPSKHTDATPSDSAVETYEMLLGFFEVTILPTYKSRFTQFLLFWAAQQSADFADQLCVTLIEKALDNTRPQGARLAAASYISGFVSRARTMTASNVRAVVWILCRWLSEFVDQRSTECSGPDVARWGGFYAIVQAVLYIFCFRWRDLREADEDEFGIVETQWCRGLEILGKVVHSRFNPLKVCAWPVVESFAEIAAHFQFLFVHTIIEQNRRTGLVREGEGLDTYFPFDPFKLARSRRWIDGIYVEWQPVEGLHDVEDSEEESEDEADEADEEDEDAADSDNSSRE